MVRDLPHTELARFTQIDYEREMSFIATAADGAGRRESFGEVRAVANPDNMRAEFAIMARSDIHLSCNRTENLSSGSLFQYGMSLNVGGKSGRGVHDGPPPDPPASN